MTLTATNEKRISYTQLNMFLRCGEQYRRRYIEGEIIPPSGSLVRGRTCHAAEEKNFRQKIQSKQDLPLAEVLDAFSTAWEEEKYSIAFTEEELEGQTPTAALGTWKDSGVALLTVYQEQIAPLARPTHVEQGFTVNFQGGYPPLIGYLDRIDDHTIIADVKHVAKSPSQGAIDSDMQMTVYDLGFRTAFGRTPTALVRECAVATKTPKTVVQRCEARSPQAINHLLCRIEAFLDAMQKGVFLPADNGHWCCSPKWCGYYHSCKYRQ
ncbi:MAG: PD-(D/E)XK nuclease family protein [Armatimonadota bacterium]|nr:PD-(D/E)XK nuclease family protein [Armatimonadota bacterium]